MIPYAACLLLGCVMGYILFYFTTTKKEKVHVDTSGNYSVDTPPHEYHYDINSNTLHRRGSHIPVSDNIVLLII